MKIYKNCKLTQRSANFVLSDKRPNYYPCSYVFRKAQFMRNILFVFLLLTVFSASAQDTLYWSIEIPTPEYAKNVEHSTTDRYFTKMVAFEVENIQPEAIAEFYSGFFAELDWSDPTADFPNRAGLPGKWSGYNMRFNADGTPEATYGKSWLSAATPVMGTLNLVLTDYSTNGFSGKATITISPKVDMSPLIDLNELLTNNPKNLFVLYQALGSNPFEVQEISVPQNYLESNNPLLKNYYQIVKKVEASYKEFGEKHIAE